MRYPKKGEVVWAVGKLGPHWCNRWKEIYLESKTPAIIVEGGVDPKGYIKLILPTEGLFWVQKYQVIYPDTNLCADGQPRWNDVWDDET